MYLGSVSLPRGQPGRRTAAGAVVTAVVVGPDVHGDRDCYGAARSAPDQGHGLYEAARLPLPICVSRRNNGTGSSGHTQCCLGNCVHRTC